MDENSKLTPIEIVTVTVVGSAALYGAYHLGKLCVDWMREGVRILEEKKDQAN